MVVVHAQFFLKKILGNHKTSPTLPTKKTSSMPLIPRRPYDLDPEMKFRDRVQQMKAMYLYCTCCLAVGCFLVASPSQCGAELKIWLDSYDPHGFWISLHRPVDDQVVSKGIRDSLRYASVDEMQAVCALPHVRCCDGRLFVEVGSSIGMVSLFAAARDMRVMAFDPLEPNVRRMQESRCLNSCRAGSYRRNCANFDADRFGVFHHLVGAQPDPVGRTVTSEPGNLAATMRGGGWVRTPNVTTVTIDDAVGIGDEIEVLLLTCQGAEYDALLGASMHLVGRRVRNVVWRRHHTADARGDEVTAKQILHLLWSSGFRFFYDLEASRRSGAPPRLLLSDQEVLEYVMRQRAVGEHPNLLASLGGLDD